MSQAIPRIELYRSDGHIEQVALSPDRTVVVGQHAQCDLVITDEAVHTIHIRVSWTGSHYQVSTAPGVSGVSLNGEWIQQAKLHSSDELIVGRARLKVVLGETVELTEGKPDPVESTHVLDSERNHFSVLIEDDEDTETEPSVSRTPNRNHVGTKVTWWRRKDATRIPFSEHSQSDPTIPGNERLAVSPLVWGLGAAVVFLIGAAVFLWMIISRESGSRAYETAYEAYQSRNYTIAIRRFDRLVADFPDHEQIDQARAMGMLTRILQFCDGNNPSALRALQEVQRMMDQRDTWKRFSEIEGVLGGALYRLAQKQVDQAVSIGNQDFLRQGKEAWSWYETLAELKPSESAAWDEKVVRAQEQIEKTVRFDTLLREGEQFLGQEDVHSVYRSHYQFFQQHPNYLLHPRSLEQINQAITLEKNLVQWTTDSRVAESEHNVTGEVVNDSGREDPQAFVPQTAILADLDYQSPVQLGNSQSGKEVFVQFRGACFALEKNSGKVLWRHPCGEWESGLPLTFSNDQGRCVLLINNRLHTLEARDARTGKRHWQKKIEGEVESSPLILGSRIFLPVRSRLLVLDVNSGEIQGLFTFPQSITCGVIGPDNNQLYLVGEQAVVYVISTDSFQCQEVVYLGHWAGSIRTNPLVMDKYLLIAENATYRNSRLHVLQKSQADTFGVVQRLELTGWVTESVVHSGNLVWALTDQGQLYAYQVNPFQEDRPFTLITSTDLPDLEGEEAYMAVASGQEVWIGAGDLTRYRLSVQQQQIRVAWNQTRSGTAAQSLQIHGDYVFLAEFPERGPGIFFSAVDGHREKTCWTTQLGDSILTSYLSRSSDDPLQWTGLTTHGKSYDLTPFRHQNVIFDRAINQLDVNAFFDNDQSSGVWVNDSDWVAGSTGQRSLLVWNPSEGTGYWIDLPFAISAGISAFRQGILIPADDQRLYWLSAQSGEQRAIPFQSPLDVDRPVLWKRPAVLDNGDMAVTDSKSNLFQLEVSESSPVQLTLKNTAALRMSEQTEIVSVGEAIYGIDQDGQLVAFSTKDLAVIGRWPLGQDYEIGGMWKVDRYLFLKSFNNEWLCADDQGKLLWRVRFPDAIVGPPILSNGGIFLIQREGKIHRINIHDGTTKLIFDTREVLVRTFQGPEERLIVVCADGALLALQTTASKEP